MKRLFLLLITAILCNLGAMAQNSLVATLQHGTNFRAYYGPDALSEAHENASDGDIITLSAGEFNACNTTKAVTIRGEGMHKTVIAASEGKITFAIPHGSAYSLSLEGLTVYNPGRNYDNGVWFVGTDGTESVAISQCYMNCMGQHFTNCNAVILQCATTDWNYANYEYGLRTRNNSRVTCKNSILKNVFCVNTGTFDIQHCAIWGNLSVSNSSIKNSIISTEWSLDWTNTSSHCLVKEGSSGFTDSWYIKTSQPEPVPDPWGEQPATPTYTLWDELFSGDWHLTEEAAATYVGTDGKEVGIYGGANPYGEAPNYPLVKNLDVMGVHKDGKLQVQINIE